MEWKLFSEEENEDFNEVEMKDAYVDGGDVEDEVVEKTERVIKPANARRAIEILREQKQLEEDTWDFFDQ